MSNECEKHLELVLADAAGPLTAAHCRACPDCATLAADWHKLREAALSAPAVPLSLDFAVRTAAANALRERARKRKVTIRRIIYYSAAAACVALACLVTIFPPAGNRKNQAGVAKNWDWVKFDNELFETAAAIEISSSGISISGKPTAPPLPDIADNQDNELR